MGSSQSSTGTQSGLGQNDGQSDTLRLAMANLRRREGAVTGGSDGISYFGGCGGYFGGAVDADPAKGLRDYEASLSAKAKEDVIRRIAAALKRTGIKVDPEGDLDAIVKSLIEQIPNPRRANGKFKADAESQVTVCKVVAGVLNDEFTPGVTKHSEMFIDTSLSPAELCRAVGEWAHSFAAGVNTEFLAVHASVKNALRNIEILEKIMAEIYGKIKGKVDEARDPKLSRETEPLHEIYARAQSERLRQEEMLKNILHVQLAPAAKELELAMRDESEQNALIKKLGLKPGTSEFAETLANAISGLGTAASVAMRVHKALKRVGLSVRQYLDSSEFVEFQRLLDSKLESGAVKADDFAEFIKAIDTLRLAFSDRKESNFREALEGADKTGGATKGGEDEYKSTMDKRVDKVKTERSLIIRDFVGRMARHYDELLAAVKSLSPELGKKIPLSDKTDALREALIRLQGGDSRSERIELALVGRYTDAAARERKERFIGNLRLVASACSSLMELEMFRGASSYLARLKAAIETIEKTVDTYSDIITKKFGGDVGGDDEVSDLYHGGADDDKDLLPEISRSALSLNEAVSEFAYFYYVARVRSNLAQSAKEIDVFGEKYVEVLGDAVAARLLNLRKTRANIMTYLDNATNRAAGGPLAGVFPAGAAGDAKVAATKKLIDAEFEIKEKFYRALQAMDLYMKAFTAGIVKDPDAARDIKKDLDGTQVIARWFNDSTGESLWKSFENMGSINFATAAKVAPAAPGLPAATAGDAVLAVTREEHYYAKVGAVVATPVGATFGIPQVGVDAGPKADAVKKNVSDLLESFQALKNLVNAFARIGSKFGGRELRTQVFMSPTQIYKALVDYLKQSALSVNAGSGAMPTSIAVTAPLHAGAVVVADGVAPYQVFFGSVQTALGGSFVAEDRYFSLIIKAMAAKILTTLGVFDMFERRSPIYDLTPTRLIVGGGDEDDPEVVEGATELYFRMPRLVEFYRGFLLWDGTNPGDDYRIAMLPEVEGVFSGIIRIVFQKRTDLSSGDYSDSELRAVVREINQIYSHFHSKDGERAVQAAMSALVMEVNRRYGIIKGDDMRKYWELMERARRGMTWGSLNDTNYAILPGEEEHDIDRRAPSDRWTVPGAVSATSATGLPSEFAGRPMLDEDALFGQARTRRMMLRDLRTKLEKEFSIVPRDQFGKTSFSLLIKQADAEIRRVSSKESKYAVATKLIQGTNVVSLDANKAYMFHETAVVGLNMLGSIHEMINAYSDQIDRYNPATLEKVIMDALHTDLGVRDPPDPFGKAALLGLLAAPMAARFDRYILAGVSGPAVAGDALQLRGGISAVNVNAGHLYGFWRLEGTFARAGAGALPAAPSTYDSDAKVAALTPPQQRAFRAMRLFARMVTDYGRMMREYIENVFDIASTSGGLVEVRLPQGAAATVQIGFTKLRSLVESLLTDVKNYMDTFRPFISADVMKRFEDRTVPGSVFYIEENLVDRRFRGVSDSAEDQKLTLDGISRRTSEAFLALTRDTRIAVAAAATAANFVGNNDPARGAVIAALVAEGAAGSENQVEAYGRALSEIVYYDASQEDSAQTGLNEVNIRLGVLPDSRYELGSLIATDRALAAPTAPGPLGLQRHEIYSTSGGMTRHRSLMFAFNQIVSRYLGTLSDPSGSRKIYLTLVNAYANGVAAQSVSTPAGNSFPDLGRRDAFGNRGDPVSNAILFQSLAYVLQRLVKDVNPTTQVSDHLVTTLTEVPLYLKERYRVNLPGFVRLFDLIVQKGEFIKQFIQKTRINCARPSQITLTAAAGATTKIKVPAVAGDTGDRTSENDNHYTTKALAALRPLSGAKTDAEMKVILVEIIEAVSTGAYTLSSSAADVLKELGDSPVYFQTQEGSIQTYKTRYSKLPLMPLSLSLYFLNDLTRVGTGYDDVKLFPRVALGEPQFKVQYGVRGLLIRQGAIEFAQMPGVLAALEAYNGVSGKREQLDPARYTNFVKTIVTALRFVVDARNYKSTISTTSQVFSFAPLIGAGKSITPFAATTPPTGNASFAIRKTEQDVVTVVESTNQDESMNQMVAVAGGISSVGRSGGRAMERILNLVDMNIIPINVHALMRDVPLANLYNYEYTFEQMVASLYGEAASKFEAPLSVANTKQTRELFIRMLFDPYLDLGGTGAGAADQATKMYGSDVLDLGTGGFVHRMFRGDNNTGLSRPKFLADQLFNKALFGSVYQAQADFDESGPGTGAGLSRGQANSTTTPVQDAGWTRQDGAGLRATMGHRASRLSYLVAQPTAGAGPETVVQEVPVGSWDTKSQLEAIGRMRFDTRLVRNLVFTTNILRVIRMKLNRELTQSRSVLVSSHSAVSSSLTEYGSDPFGPNETLGSTLPGGMSRFNDSDTF